MKSKKVFRNGSPTQGSTLIPNILLRHPQISDATLGMLVRLMSHSQDIPLDEEFFSDQIEEAIQLGFMQREIVADQGGDLVVYSLTIGGVA